MGGSQFGCPVDAFNKTTCTLSSSSNASWHIRNDFPRGLSRLIQHPTWLSRGCSVPLTCEAGTKTYDYKDWVQLDSKEIREVACINADGSQSNVTVMSGWHSRAYFRKYESSIIEDPDKAQWATNLGATREEAETLASIRDPRKIWDYVQGLMNKAGILKFQSWIARDVGLFLKSFNMPLDQEYSAIHIRRGDKLIEEARSEVERYWKSQGYTDMNKLPADYVPFAHYLRQWDSSESCTANDDGAKKVMKHNVYIATDDPIVVRQEIDELENHVDANTILWNDCHELTFYFNPTNASAFHLSGKVKGKEATEDSCFARYDRNIVSIVDMMILSKARTFIGEYNSNWGRLIRTVRVRLNDTIPLANEENRNKNVNTKQIRSFTQILDTRVAFGKTIESTPGW